MVKDLKNKSSGKKSKIKDKKEILKNKNFILISIGIVLIIGIIILISSQDSKVIEDNVIATVNGIEITESQVIEIQEQSLAQGMQISNEDALEQLINSELLIQEAKKQGFDFTKQEVEENLEIQSGNSIEEIKQELEIAGESYDELIEGYISYFMIEEYLKSIVEEVEVSDEEVENYYNELKEEYNSYGEELPAFEEIKEDLKNSLEYEKQQEIIIELIEDLREQANIEYLQDLSEIESIEEDSSEQDFIDALESGEIEIVTQE
jgi:hypothetical protein